MSPSPRLLGLLLALAVLCASGPARAGTSLRERFELADAAGEPWYVGVDNDSAALAWGASYLMLAYVYMFRATEDPGYLDRLVRVADRVLDQRDSVRGVTDYTGQSRPCWRAANYSTEPMCWAVHTGLILQPMVELSVLLDAHPSLAERRTYDGVRLADKAATYYQAAVAGVAVHQGEYRNDGADRGYYLFPTDATFYPNAGKRLPLNQMNALGLTYAAIAQASGAASPTERVRRLANTFLAALTLGPGGGYRWNYNGGAYLAPGEDVSHAAINVLFAVRAAEAGIVFDASHLTRFATTFTDLVVDTRTAYDHVGASGSTNSTSYRPQLTRWALLTPWNVSVAAYLRQQLEQLPPQLNPSIMLGLAMLLASEPRLRPFDFYRVDWVDLGDRRQASALHANILVAPGGPSMPVLAPIHYRAARPARVEQWDGRAYHPVLRLAATGADFETAYVPYQPAHWFDYGGQGALYQFGDAFVSGEGITLMEPQALLAPVITSQPPASARVGVEQVYRPAASGSAPLHWRLELGPQGAAADRLTGELRFTPSAVGAVDLRLRVENDVGTAAQAFTVHVIAEEPAGPDAGTRPDAGPDEAGDAALEVPTADAGRGAEEGLDGLEGGGCGCLTGGAGPASWLWAMVLADWLGSRRRRRATPASNRPIGA